MQVLPIFIVAIAALFVLSIVLALPVLWLWNWLCPELFHLPVIDIWQAWGLTALCSTLFKSTNSTSKS